MEMYFFLNKIISGINGILSVADLFNRAYIRHFFDNVLIMFGLQFMPYQSNDSANIQRLINVIGATFYPIAISLLMPLFMYTIILEKEEKLIEIMKINGLKMRNYWISLFTYNLILYLITITVFYLFGFLVLRLSFFTETNPLLMIIILFGWGLNQIGLAFFFQAFLTNARSATSIFYQLNF
jgi:hypothetical protein